MKKRYLFAICLFISLWILVQLKNDTQGGSTFSVRPQGLKALFLVLQENKVPVKTWQFPLTELDSKVSKQVLFVVSPKKQVNLFSLLDWVEQGNTIVAAGEPAHSLIVRTLTSESKEKTEAGQDTTDAALQIVRSSFSEPVPIYLKSAHPLLANVSRITQPATPFKEGFSGYEVVARNGETPYVLRKSVGKGEIWLFSEIEPMSNQHIDQFDNLRMMYQIAASGESVLFDEFHHGYVAPVKSEMRARQDSMIVMIVFLVLALTLAALSRAIRFGPPRYSREQLQAKTSEFASVLGMLYRERRITDVLQYYREAWRLRLENQHGLSRNIEDARLVDAMRQKGIVSNQDSESVRKSLADLARESGVNNNQLEQSVVALEEILRDHEQFRSKSR
jgi:hypothetical protein